MSGVNGVLLAAALAAAGAAPARAELSLESVHWQTGRVEAGRVSFWRDVKTWPQAPTTADRLRARLVLRNEGPLNEEGLLLRYSLTARVLSNDGSAADGSWAVPFTVDEKRVPKVGAEKTIEVPLDPGTALDLYLRRLARADWRPDRIKISVMIEPHRGSKALQLVEDVLEIGGSPAKP
ncbi:MAG: hypothetical protein ACHQ49_09135 [Elusimicrobiota bacterium]